MMTDAPVMCDPDNFRPELRAVQHRGKQGAPVCTDCGEPYTPGHCAALAKDAARYRFIREGHKGVYNKVLIYAGPSLDREVDAAMVERGVA